MKNLLGAIIRDGRRAKKMTLRDLSEKTGIDYSMISKYENGLIYPPQEKLRLIADVLSISEDTLFNAQIFDSHFRGMRPSDVISIDEDSSLPSSAGKVVVKTAKGRCELCNQFFPNGESFLEFHYLVNYQDGGTPTIDNAVALCPNCHKRIRLFNDPKDLEILKRAAEAHKTDDDIIHVHLQYRNANHS